MAKRYDWKRFWCPRDGKIDLSDDGFLTDPERKYYEYSGSDVVPFEKISDKACLVLLGEPGIGKSTTMVREYEAITDGAKRVAFFNLSSYGNETRLIGEVFESEQWEAWRRGDYTLHLFLDSLDECRILIHQVAVILSGYLASVKGDLNRLCLRIACRTADWPSVLENSLKGLWKEERIAVYELAPLRKADVRLAAEANGLDGDGFLKEVIRHEVDALAIKPITLEFLMGTYMREGKLPSSKIDLYDAGCRKLCEESNPNRQDLTGSGKLDALSADERLGIAKEIAAVSVFCRRPAIHTGSITEKNPDDLYVSELAKDRCGVSERTIKDVIGTGLFSGRGPQKFGFAHQTYAEFLAARYLSDSGMELEQVESILYCAIRSERKVVPQLYETSAWLACLNKKVFNSIVESDPQVLLRGDAGSYSDKERRLLVGSILELLSAGRINTRDWGLYRTYHKLKYSGLGEQLRAYIQDVDRPWHVRHEAIEIAESCAAADLAELLADIALEQSDAYSVRSIAARAVGEIGSEDCRKRLMPLALGQGGDDPQDQLKGNALRALWPSLIDAKMLFNNLTVPEKSNYFGSYDSFLSFELVRGLKSEDILYALRWLEGMVNDGKLTFTLERVADDIMILAWKNLDQPGVVKTFVDVCIAAFRKHKGILRDSEKWEENKALFDNSDKRHLVTEAIVTGCDDFEKISIHLARRDKLHLVRDVDIDWLLEKHKEAGSKEKAKRWAKLIIYTYTYEDTEHCKKIAEAAILSDELRDVLGLEVVELDSEQAAKLKECYADAEKWRERANRKKEPAKIQPPAAECVQICLSKIEGTEGNRGNIDFWYNLCMQLTLEATSDEYAADKCLQLDIARLPGWVNSDGPTHERIITAAERFLKEKTCDPLKWINEPRRYSANDLAANKALCLLMKAAPEKFEILPVDIWENWLPAILGVSLIDKLEREDGWELVRLAYEKCSEKFASVLSAQIDGENKNADSISVHEKLELCWDERLCGVVLDKIKQPYIRRGQFNSFKNVLGCLVEQKHGPAIQYAKTLIAGEWSAEDEEGKKAIDAAIVLIENTDDACWDTIWGAIESSTEFGRELLQELASFGRSRGVASLAEHISESSMGDLYIWLERQFPHLEDPQHNGAHAVGKREAIARFRDDLLRLLENMGTVGACKAIEKIADALPELDWLKTVLVEAKKNAMRKIWQPPTPEQLLAMASRKDTRLVRNGDELQDAVVESLRRLEIEFQGETPSANDVWETLSNRPKCENDFSDYVKRFLKRDLRDVGIAALREVEIRRYQGNAPGENTDIYVTVCVPSSLKGGNERITIIVETKGCWNAELLSAMETQLAKRYLKGNQCCHGVYLVGWFACPQCQHENCKSKICKKRSINDMREQLNAQAAELGRTGLSIRAVVLDASLH